SAREEQIVTHTRLRLGSGLGSEPGTPRCPDGDQGPPTSLVVKGSRCVRIGRMLWGLKPAGVVEDTGELVRSESCVQRRGAWVSVPQQGLQRGHRDATERELYTE